jgi:hypothetical protein
MKNRKIFGVLIASLLTLLLIGSGAVMASNTDAKATTCPHKTKTCQQAQTKSTDASATCAKTCPGQAQCTTTCPGSANCEKHATCTATCDHKGDCDKKNCTQAGDKSCCKSGTKDCKKDGTPK